MKTKTDETYAELERRCLHDLAARTLSDRHAPVGHVTAARAVLATATAKPTDIGPALRQIPPATMLAIRDLLRAAQERRTGLPVPPTSPLAANPPTPDELYLTATEASMRTTEND